jgi:serine/threonine protein kinase, bacterial
VQGTPFGRYQLLNLLGRGGMGEVWRASDSLTDGRIVALKILPAELADDQVYQQRFRREAQVAARLNEPHVIPIHGYGEIDGRLYVDMRYVNGRDLESVLRDGPLDPARAVRIIGQVAQALQAAHNAGLVHRDVKPSNILLDDNDFAYLIDFGIARLTEATTESALTATGSVIGTLYYMAPERFRVGDVEASADIYALACVLYEVLTGGPPYPGSRFEQQLYGHVSVPPPLPSHTNAALPARLDDVVTKGMAKTPEERYATTVDLAEAANKAITSPGSGRATDDFRSAPTVVEGEHVADDGPEDHDESTPPSPWWKRRTFLVSGAALLTVVVLAVAVIVLVSGGDDRLPVSYTTLPFHDLSCPCPLAASDNGTVYVGQWPDSGADAVMKLPPSDSTPISLQANGIADPRGLAVDNSGTVYIADAGNHGQPNPTNDEPRVVAVSRSGAQRVLPFSGLGEFLGVAVDGKGTVFVADSANKRVLALRAGASTQSVLPFIGLSTPVGVAVDSQSTVYVTDNNSGGESRVLSLTAGSAAQKVRTTQINDPRDIAVDPAGTIYVSGSGGGTSEMWKIPAGSTTPVSLKLPRVTIDDVAVDHQHNLYVSASGRILKVAVD